MADEQNQITKIYELRSLGYDQIIQELDAVNKSFAEIKKTKQDLNKLKFSKDDSAALKEQKAQTDALKVAEQELRNERLRLNNEAKAAAIIRQQEINQAKTQKAANDAEAGSYTSITKALKELYALTKPKTQGSTIDFRGQILTYDQAIAKLKELTAAEQAFRRQFAADKTLVGEYTTGIIQAFKQLGLDDLIGGQVTKSNARLSELNKEFEQLKTELSGLKVNGQGSLEVIEKKLVDNRKEAIALEREVGRIKTEFRGAGDVGNQISTSISNGFKSARQQLGQFVLQYIGFQAVLSGASAGVETAKELSDQTSNLEVELGKAAGGAKDLVDQLAKLDTRTKLAVLENIANIAAKAGVSEENLIGVTEALDKIKIAFGKDFGDVETGTESLVKIINIFEGADNVTGDNLLRVGNAIRTLANESVASVPFLNDFTRRMAGLKGTFDVSLPSVLGLASGFENFGQSAEVSSTALVRIIPKLAADTQKYAAIAGVAQKAFAELINTNPAEALLKVSQGLVQGKGSVEEFSAAFADSELGSGRVASIIGVLGANTDEFRHKIDLAATSFGNTSNITDAFAAKNNNLAATLDKISKRFADAANSKAFQIALTAISSVIILLLNNLPALIALGSALAINWAVQNASLLLLRGSMIGYNILIARNYVLMGLLSVANGIYTASMFILNGAYAVVTRAAAFFNLTLSSTPIGLILTGIALLIGVMKAFGNTVSTASEKLAAQTRQAKLMNETMNEAQKAIIETTAKEKLYLSIINDHTISLNTRQKALKDLIALNPEYLKGLTLENIAMQEGKDILDKYNKALLQKALTEASAARSSREFQKLVSLQTLQQDVEFALKAGTGVKLDEVSGDLIDQLAKSGKIPFAESLGLTIAKFVGGTLAGTDLQRLSKVVSSAITAQSNITKDVMATAEIINQQNIKTSSGAGGVAPGAGDLPETLDSLRKELKILNQEIAQTDVNSKKLDELKAKRDAIKAKIKAIQGTTKPAPAPRADRLTVDDQNKFKDIEAARDEDLTKEKTNFESRTINEETFLNRSLDINRKAIDAKLKLLDASNAEERRKIGQLHLDKITLESETNKKLFDLHQKQLQDQLENDKRDAAALGSAVVNNPTATGLDRAQVKLTQDQALLAAQERFNTAMDALEKKFNVDSKSNAEARADVIQKINNDLFKDTTEVSLANLEDIKRAGEQSVAEFELIIDRAKLAIFANQSLSQAQKESRLQALEAQREFGILARQAATFKILEAEFKKAKDAGLITVQEYEAIVKKLAEIQGKLATTTDKPVKQLISVGEFLQKSIRDAFGATEGSATDQLIGKAIQQSYSLAQDAMHGYFDAEQKRVEQSKQLALERIDLEEEQVKARATSTDQLAAIDKEYAAKRRKAERDAGEALKKSKRSEAKLALATELAGIAASAALNPANAPTFGAAGAIMYAVLSAIAFGRYAIRIGEINRETFAGGGRPGQAPVPTRGGKFGGKPHSQGGTPFKFKGNEYEAEVDELSVIRTKGAPKNKVFNITGNQVQIASMLNEIGGGIRFAPGAKLKKFADGGFIGESLQAPVFSPIVATVNGSSSGDMNKVLDAVVENSKAIQAVNGRIDRLQVVQDTRTVTSAQKKQVSQSNVGTL
jgi:hypothetical protein